MTQLTEDENIALRDLNHSPGWLVYRRIAEDYIYELFEAYLRENLTQDLAWGARVELKAIKAYQRYMDDWVRQAVDAIDRKIAQFYNPEGDLDAGIEH